MSPIFNQDKDRVREQNISFYDEISHLYDHMLNQKESDKLAREKVKEKLTGLLETGRVLDFGGGTGLDLEWLTGRGYHIHFCEPAVAMREKAMACNDHRLHYNNLFFLETEQTDYTTWPQKLPFPQKMDAILANFGVLNCIPDLPRLFNSLALVIKPGGHFITLLLDRNLKRMLKWHRRNAIRSLFFRSPFIMYVWHKDHRQTVYVHTLPDIQKAAAPFFEYRSHEPVAGSDFVLLHFVRR